MRGAYISRVALPGVMAVFALAAVAPLFFSPAGDVVNNMVLAVPTLRLRGDYIAIVTLAFGEIIGQIVFHGREIELFGGTLTAGPVGITPIDRIELPLIGRFGAL